MIRGVTDLFSKLRKHFHRRDPREEPRRRNLTEDELEMQNMMAGDIATTSKNNDADNLNEAMSEGLSPNDEFAENNTPDNNIRNIFAETNRPVERKLVSRSVSTFVLGHDNVFRIVNQNYRRSIK